jgi:hypothetical protein
LLRPPDGFAAAVAELKHSTDTFGRLIRAQADRIPDRTALKFERETVTYTAYNDEVNRTAALLAQAGIGAGSVVAILCQNSPRFLVALGAVAKLGAVGALLNTHLGGAALTHVLRTSDAGVGITHAIPALAGVAGTHAVRFFADVDAGAPLPAGVVSLHDALPARAAEPAPPEVRGHDVFLYIYTSGTTGYPKPAIVRHVRFTLGGIGLAALLELQPGETVYAPLPLPWREPLRGLRARVPQRRGVRVAAGVQRQRVPGRRAPARRGRLGLRGRALPLPAPPAALATGSRPHAPRGRRRGAPCRRLARLPGALRHPAHHRDVRRHRRQRRAAESRRTGGLGRQALRGGQ